MFRLLLVAAIIFVSVRGNECVATSIFGNQGRIETPEHLQSLVNHNCTSIDFLWVNCPDCPQWLWAQLDTLTRITGADPVDRYSLLLANCGLVTSLDNLGNLRGTFIGGIVIEANANLPALSGLASVVGINSKNLYGRKVVLANNAKMKDASSLEALSANITSQELRVQDNPRLWCTPANWPARDYEGHIIKH